MSIRWTERDLAYLKEHYATAAPEELARELGRSARSIHLRAERLGLTLAAPPELPVEDQDAEASLLEQALTQVAAPVDPPAPAPQAPEPPAPEAQAPEAQAPAEPLPAPEVTYLSGFLHASGWQGRGSLRMRALGPMQDRVQRLTGAPLTWEEDAAILTLLPTEKLRAVHALSPQWDHPLYWKGRLDASGMFSSAGRVTLSVRVTPKEIGKAVAALRARGIRTSYQPQFHTVLLTGENAHALLDWTRGVA